MASNYTPNLNLCQWAEEDAISREEFNADNAKIDAALRELATGGVKIAVGSYNGNGAASRTISLDFTPKAVFVCTRDGQTYNYDTYTNQYYYTCSGGLALPGKPALFNQIVNMSETYLTVVDNGFTVRYERITSGQTILTLNTNGSTYVYYYLAVG